ncbi:MAG: U32 family peptidase [Clostridia bacterium]|nr:U32 family peptidase [Clostridia bacterium]
MPERIPELLCPAGSREAALAALCGGADALYMGASGFGARAGAGFDAESLNEIITLAHLYGRRVYVTVNTLVKENELPALRDTLSLLCSLRADAVLVQDLGVLEMIANEFPQLCVHASTQMALHNAEGARLLHSLGVNRVVLARECTLETIRAVAETGMETEVFIHGAQCVCVSGQCRYSGLIGGRSGNRGRCAQPCRLPYEWEGQSGYWLSPRDLCLYSRLQALTDAGVSALKIEGRLKRPEYVSVVTGAYRQALDAIAAGRPVPPQPESVSKVFSRGFFSGYAFGDRDNAVINPVRPSAAGVPIGRIGRVWQKGTNTFCDVQLTGSLHNGDGLQVRGRSEQDLIYSGPDVPSGQRAVLRLHHAAAVNDEVVRIDDEQLLSAARAASGEECLPRISFDAVLSLQIGEPASLTVTSGEVSVTVQGDTVEAAQSAPLDAERVRRAVGKTGDTHFALNELSVSGEGGYLSAASLNSLRRSALAELKQACASAHPLPGSNLVLPPRQTPVPGRPRLYVQFCHAGMAQALLSAGAEELIYAPLDVREPVLSEELSKLPENAYVALPVQLTDAAQSRLLTAIANHHLRLWAGSVGQLAPDHDAAAGEGVPCWNSLAADMLARFGVHTAVLPRELKGAEIAAMTAGYPHIEWILPVYGRARLMYLNHCPARTALGMQGKRDKCTLCDQGRGCLGRSLTDRMGKDFPLLPVHADEGCLVQLLSCDIRELGEYADRRYSWLVDLTVESKEESCALVKSWRAAKDGGALPETGALERYINGVE